MLKKNFIHTQITNILLLTSRLQISNIEIETILLHEGTQSPNIISVPEAQANQITHLCDSNEIQDQGKCNFTTQNRP